MISHSLVIYIFYKYSKDYGDLEFQPISTTNDIHKEVGGRIHAIPLPGGESYEDTMKRTAKFLSVRPISND